MNEKGKQWFRDRSVKALFIAVFLPLGAVAQETPWDVEDLVDIRASSGERALVDRGYVFVKAEQGDDRVWTNWWNRSTHTCITVATVNGRYDSIVDSPPFDCGRADMTSGGTPDRRSWTSELVGVRATALSGEMESRGFDNVDGYKDDDTVYTWWYDRDDDACLRAEVSDGRIQRIVPTPHFHACH